jgi:hypothetical protein
MTQAKTGATTTALDRAARTFKTPPVWWQKGIDRPATQQQLAKLLEDPVDSRCFDSLPTPTSIATPEDRVCWIRSWEGLKPHFSFIPDQNIYDVEGAYEKAKSESDGEYSPHTAFRNLSRGDNWAAIDFVNEFGPLELLNEAKPRQVLELEELMEIDLPADGETNTYEVQRRPVWVDIDDFWQKHKRFTSVVKLWEARESPKAVLSAIAPLVNLSVYPRIGARRLRDQYIPTTPFPFGNFDKWKAAATMQQIMAVAAETIERELALNSYLMKPNWRSQNPSTLTFRLVPTATSLWSAIWHLFARDTSEGLGWRICPHCSKLFYPKRRDSYFCESKYQKLHAAKRWWHEHKETELESRRKERARRARTRKKTAPERKPTLADK